MCELWVWLCISSSSSRLATSIRNLEVNLYNMHVIASADPVKHLFLHTHISPKTTTPHTQSSICTELIRRLLAFRPALHAASTAVAELDCLLSLAAVARDGDYCRPQLVEEPVLEIKQGVCVCTTHNEPWLLLQSSRTHPCFL